MIAGAVLCPHPPLLLAGATGGTIVEVEVLRQCCISAFRDLVSVVPDRLVVVGCAGRGEATGVLSPTAPSPAGRIAPAAAQGTPATAAEHEVALPISLDVGRTLLEQAKIDPARAEFHAVPAELPAAECVDMGAELVAGAERVGLIVLADGSARRRPGSPGYVDDRAIAFDADIEKALLTRDLETIKRIDPTVAADLWVTGRVGWQVLAGALAGIRMLANLRYSDDPFGVWYAVMDWTPIS